MIERLRLAAFDGDDAITEQIKWTARSFCLHSVDRVTFDLRQRHQVWLIFHRGTKSIEDDFHFDTSNFDISKWRGLLEMIGQERGQMIIPSAETATARQEEFLELVREWIRP